MKIEEIENTINMHEAAYSMNIGFQEMVEFYQKANPKEVKEMEKIIKNSNWNAFKKLINKVLGIELN